MRTKMVAVLCGLLCAVALSALGQSLDVAVSAGSIGSGVWPGGSVTGMFSPHFGADAEFAAGTGLPGPADFFFASPLPPAYRQYLLDFNGVYRPRGPGARFQPELLAGGAISIQHASEFAGCNGAGECALRPAPLTAGSVHVATGLTVYAAGRMFVRAAAHLYSSGYPSAQLLLAVSIGYTFGGAR